MNHEIARWQTTAETLGDEAAGLRLELTNLAADPSPHRLARALSAAFWTAERVGSRTAVELIDDMREALSTQ